MAKQKKASARRRNAATTRAAILASARKAFARAGYDGAGVTAMLVNRYFGSKEQLFAEVIAATMANPTILTGQNLKSARLGETIAATLVGITRTGDTPLEGFLILSTPHQASAQRKSGAMSHDYKTHKTFADRNRGRPGSGRLVDALIRTRIPTGGRLEDTQPVRRFCIVLVKASC